MEKMIRLCGYCQRVIGCEDDRYCVNCDLKNTCEIREINIFSPFIFPYLLRWGGLCDECVEKVMYNQ